VCYGAGEETGHRHDAALQPRVVVGGVGGGGGGGGGGHGQSEHGQPDQLCRLHGGADVGHGRRRQRPLARQTRARARHSGALPSRSSSSSSFAFRFRFHFSACFEFRFPVKNPCIGFPWRTLGCYLVLPSFTAVDCVSLGVASFYLVCPSFS